MLSASEPGITAFEINSCCEAINIIAPTYRQEKWLSTIPAQLVFECVNWASSKYRIMTGANASRKIAFAPGTFTTTTTALIKLIMSSQLPENNSSNDHLKFTPAKKWCGFCKIAGHTWNECYKRNEKGSGGNEKGSGGKKGSGFSILIILKVLLIILTVLLNPESQIFLFKFSKFFFR